MRTARRFSGTWVGVALVLALVGGLLPARFATAQLSPNIEFLNPSNFATTPDVGIIVSDKQPNRPTPGDQTYRLSAWVAGVPENPAVEFELLQAGVSLFVIDDVVRVGTDTFEADWAIPDTLPDGRYTLRATLASGLVGVDSVDQSVMIQRLADRAEITYPDTRGGAGQFGSFVPLAAQSTADGAPVAPKPVGKVDGRNTGVAPGNGAARVRAFYTVTPPGSPPEWIVCGTERAFGSVVISSAADNGVRCTLQALEHQGAVTAVALLANNSNDTYEARLNQAGDATRVLDPYAQVPTDFSVVSGETGTVSRGDDGRYPCFEVEVELADQVGREVVNANLDVHAWGPTDRLYFGTGPLETYASQPPDRGSHSEEQGVHCFESSDSETPGDQGDHQVIGGPDIKHIETNATGTNDLGRWGFALWVPADAPTESRHTTRWEVWLDELGDGTGFNSDAYEANELCRSGVIGWGAAPSGDVEGPSPTCPNQPPDPCDDAGVGATADPCPSQSPSPTPTTSPSPTPTDPAEEEVSIRASRKRIRSGRFIKFSGDIDAASDCVTGRRISLQSRHGNGRFRTRVLTASSGDGSWSLRKKLWRTATWRAVVAQDDSCRALTSDSIKVRVRRATRR